MRDLTEEEIEVVSVKLKRIVSTLMEMPLERIKGIYLQAAGFDNRTALNFDFSPPLNDVEKKRLVEIMKAISLALGGRPPIIPTKA